MKWRLYFVRVHPSWLWETWEWASWFSYDPYSRHYYHTVYSNAAGILFKTCFFFKNLKLRVSICECMWADRRLSRMEASEAPATLRVRNTEVLHDQTQRLLWVCPECSILNPWWQHITPSLNMKLKASSTMKHFNLCEGSTMISVCRDGWGWRPLRLLQCMKAWFSTTTALASA